MQRDQLFDTYLEQAINVFEPWRKVNHVMLASMEKTIQFQLEVVQRYSYMGTERLKAANDIREINDLQNYTSRQIELLREWTEQAMDDARILTELGMEFRDELGKAFSEVGGQATQQLDDLSRQVSEASQQVVDSTQSITEATAEVAKETTSDTATAASDTTKSSTSRSSSGTGSRSSTSSGSSSNSKSRAS